MNAKDVLRAVLAGVVGTAVMTVMTLMASAMGLPMDIPGMLSGFMQVPLFVGWLAHFMIGVVFALVYAFGLASQLPGGPVVKGALFGLIPFLLAQIMVMPMMGMGLFTSNAPNALLLVMGSLMGHLVYGGVVGAVYGPVRVASHSKAA